MQEPDLVLTQDLREMRGARLRRRKLRRLGALDQRTHPVDLRALGHRAAQAVDDLLDAIHVGETRINRFAASGLLCETRDVEIAVVRHQQRARDRRRRHHENIGAVVAALGLQGQALMDAEAMLLVDHRKGEISERHVVLE